MAELVFLRRGEELLRVALERSQLSLGRAETADVILPDPTVGRHQAAVLFDGSAAFLEDLSRQGTLESSGTTEPVRLREGAAIALGHWRAVYRGLPGADEAVAAPRGAQRGWSMRGASAGTVRVFGAEGSGEASSPPRNWAFLQPILGADPGIRQLSGFLERVASSRSVVAVFGEPGSGREAVARALHARSGRALGPFIRVNCRALRSEFLEAELLGRSVSGGGAPRRGAFEEAAGGTLFLDEVGELALELQQTLLQALESGQFRRMGATEPLPTEFRLVVATCRDLLSATRLGLFREDLFELLCMAPLILPPLRHRRGDVPTLAEHLVKTFSPRGQTVRITSEALNRLSQHAWPGNLRELRGVVQRALLMRTSRTIDVGELRFQTQAQLPERPTSSDFVPGYTLEQMLRQREREIVESALRHFDNNRERVARELGVARSTLFKRLKDWGLTKHDSQPPSA